MERVEMYKIQKNNLFQVHDKNLINNSHRDIKQVIKISVLMRGGAGDEFQPLIYLAFIVRIGEGDTSDYCRDVNRFRAVYSMCFFS